MKYIGNFKLIQPLSFEISVREICEKFVYKHSIESDKN